MPKSRLRILPDGREICRGYQWEKRKRELRERANGFCECDRLPAEEAKGHFMHYIGDEGDAHHIVKRSKQRNDSLSNLAYICRDLHILIDNRKVQWTKKVTEGK